ncbi:MAG TPA: acetoacetate--CoA ligase [Gammaproteobacteria bacterium]|jgi:acetoacetyl-CoA synthetase|nr:acetoacetate--CoA ligase [Gammaproteobacteria bacterium]
MTQPLWTPGPARIQQANISRFLDYVRRECDPHVMDQRTLYQWSVEYPDKFWPQVWAFCGIKASVSWDEALKDGGKMPGAQWFTGSRLNFAENLLRYRDERPALVFRSEHGERMSLSYRELYRQVAGLADALRKSGVTSGDRVAGFMPNRPEAVIGMLAATSIGAVWSSCSPDFGINGVLDRFGQIAPKVLITCDGYHYDNKAIDCLERIRGVLEKLPSVERVVVVPYVNARPDIAAIPKAVHWSEYLTAEQEIRFEQLAFDHPVYIMYSSGTTGVPKCIVHGAGGTLIQHLKELVLHTDLRREDVLFYFTTCGWMMWNWLVSGLAVGATVLLYDGSPFHPQRDILWRIAEEEGISIFGTSAKYLSAAEKFEVKPGKKHGLARLRTIASTGSPLLPENSEYVYRDIKANVCLSSISGGTDIISCFALGNPTLPVYPGELQCRGLGMAVEIWDDDGKPLRGTPGELVCVRPFPSMPVFFWNDPEGRKYHEAYFDRFPNVWRHGDWAELTEHDGLIIYGRSDATLNPGGVRIGTAEIYRQVEKLPEIAESLAVGQDWQGDVRVILFVRLQEGITLDEPLRKRIKQTIRDNTTPRHVPAKIIAVADIPRTISGKITELAVRNVIHGRPVKNTDALANPQALEHYRNLPELATD